MSFSKEVKNELLSIKETSKKAKKTLLYGFLYAMHFSEANNSFFLITENEPVINVLKKLLSPYNLFCSEKSITVFYNDKLKADFPELDASNAGKISVSGGDGEMGLFLRGCFLACGVINNPDVNYHLEMTPPDEKRSNALFTLINEQGIGIKKSKRKGQVFLYMTESERISDFLTYIGAALHSMEIMNVKIYKEVRNNVNRAVNCEAANITKTASAAARQLADIEYIYSVKSSEWLSGELKQVADIRLNNIEMSLKQIGEACEPKISRSGVNHRMRRINELAELLRTNNNG